VDADYSATVGWLGPVVAYAGALEEIERGR
jgi:hypothetical protein